jgi:hypothetical protein
MHRLAAIGEGITSDLESKILDQVTYWGELIYLETPIRSYPLFLQYGRTMKCALNVTPES